MLVHENHLNLFVQLEKSQWLLFSPKSGIKWAY